MPPPGPPSGPPPRSGAPKPGALGLIALLLGLVSTGGAVGLGYWAGAAVVAYLSRPDAKLTNGPVPLPSSELVATVGPGWPYFAVLTVLGLTSFVLGVTAAATGRGRPAGIAATVLSALAPAIGFLVFLYAAATG